MSRTYDAWKLQSPYNHEEEAYWECPHCKAYVSKSSIVGNLEVCTDCAETLKPLHEKALNLFTLLWKFKTKTTPQLQEINAIIAARQWLAKELKMKESECFIENLNEENCLLAIEILEGVFERSEVLMKFKEAA